MFWRKERQLTEFRATVDKLIQDRAQLAGENGQLEKRVEALQSVIRDCNAEGVALRAKTNALETAAQHHQSLVGWLCARINQLEIERAALFKHVTRVEIPTAPAMGAAPYDGSSRQSAEGDSFAHLGRLFEDVGDAEAARQGMRWDGEGRVIHAGDEKEPNAAVRD